MCKSLFSPLSLIKTKNYEKLCINYNLKLWPFSAEPMTALLCHGKQAHFIPKGLYIKMFIFK